MPKVWLHIKSARRREEGFSPVEVLLAAVVFGFLVTAVVGAVIYGRTSTASSGERNRANALAEEGIEAVRNMRDANFANLTNGTYGIAKNAGTWTLSGTSDTTGIFTRTIAIASVDAVRKTITVTITWPQGSTSAQTTVTGRLTNWMASIAAATSWPNAIFRGSYDAAGTNDGLRVVTVGNYAYAIRASGTPIFFIVNISNPAAPTLVTGGTLTLVGAPTNIAVSGNYAYVTNSLDTAELQIINITNPAAPTLAATYNATGAGNGQGVFIRGTTAYLTRANDSTTNAFEFTILNVATPTAPTLIGGYNNNNVSIVESYVPTGNYAFVTTTNNALELMVINITTPAAPTLQTSLDLATNSDATTIDGLGNTLYVGQGPVVRSINIATPTAPAVIGSVTPTGTGTVTDIDTDGVGTYAFISTNATAAEFQVIGIAAPASLSVARVVDLAGTTSTLNSVSYNAANDIVVGASAGDTLEVVTFVKN